MNESVNKKRIKFFTDALEYVVGIMPKLERRDDFYRNVFRHLDNNDTITSTELIDCDKSTSPMLAKTYVTWMDDLILNLDEKQDQIWKYCNSNDLKIKPVIVKVASTGGAGNKTYYFIDSSTNNNQEPDNVQISDSNKQKSIDANSYQIKYRTKSLKRTPRYLIFFELALQNKSYWYALVFGIFICNYILPLVWVAALFFVPKLHSLLVLLLLPVWLLIYYPTKNIINLSMKKITLLEHFNQPASAVCISEIVKEQEAKEYQKVKRLLVSAKIVATCPICCQKYNVTDSVILEHDTFLNKRIVGVCLNNPQEHRFTFDKDQMSGTRL